MPDRNDDAPERTPVEGVRIIGAEEAQAALEGGHASGRLADDELRFGEAPPRPAESGTKPAVQFPLPDDESPALGAPSPSPLGPPKQLDLTDSPSPPSPPSGPANDPGASMPLPHWTEPPTGDVPRIRSEAEGTTGDEPGAGDTSGDAADDDLDVWSRFTSAPRYRDQPSDWADHDFAPGGSLADESTRVGALREHVDPDTEFDRALAELRPQAAQAREPGEARPRRQASLEPDAPVPVAPPSEGGGRDLPTAIIVGLAIFVGALLLFKWGRAPASVLVAAIAGMATAELFAAVRARGYQPATLLGITGSVSMVLATYWKGERAFPLVVALVSLFTLVWYLVQVFEARPTINVAVTFLGFGYVGVLAGFAGLLLHQPDGIGLLLGVVVPAVAYDVAGYGFGSWLGRRKLAPRISPNKTVEGLAGGIVTAVVLSTVIVGFIAPWDHSQAVLLGFVVAGFAFLGDLCESMFKRDLGVKDLGGLLPGHGGVLDRFDALLFALPAVYYLAQILNLR